MKEDELISALKVLLTPAIKGIGGLTVPLCDFYRDLFWVSTDWPNSGLRSNGAVLAENEVIKDNTTAADLEQKSQQLLTKLTELGFQKEDINRFSCRIGRGKWWYTFYFSLHPFAVERVLSKV